MSLDRFEQALLRSGSGERRERPTSARRAAARSAMMRAAGVSTAVAAAAVTSSAPAGGAGAGAGGGALATVKTIGLVKLGLLALLSLGAVGAVVVAARPTSVAGTAPIAHVPRAAAVAVAVPPAAATIVATSVAVGDLPAAAQPANANANANANATDPLAVEARILEAARACLAAGDRACAHGQLRDHRARFPGGALTDEASILAIDVALAEGDRGEARRIALALLARRPNGSWSSRVKKLAEETAADQEKTDE